MRKTFLQLPLGITLVIFLATVDAGAVAIQPNWANWSDVTDAPNCSYLNDLRHTDAYNPLDNLIDPKTARSLTQRYQDMNRDYEMKQTYGLAGMQDVQQHGDDVQGFGRQAFGEVQKYQATRQTQQLQKVVDQDETLHTSAAVVGVGAAVYNGTPVKLKLDDDTKLQGKASVKTQTGQVSLASPLGVTAVDLNMNRPDPNLPFNPDPTQQIERYRITFSRGLPIWNLTSGLSYGGTSSSVGASLSKSLAPNLTAVVDSVRPLQQGRYYNEESLKFFYGIHF